MYLPSKHISEAQALVVVGAQILQVLEAPRHVTSCVDAVRTWRSENGETVDLPFWWFLLAMDTLFALNLIDIRDGELTRVHHA
jgi:hypothetical protein